MPDGSGNGGYSLAPLFTVMAVLWLLVAIALLVCIFSKQKRQRQCDGGNYNTDTGALCEMDNTTGNVNKHEHDLV